MLDPPSDRVPEQGPDWFLVAKKACGGGTPGLLCSSMFLGYMDIYRRKKSVRGATRGPRGWGRAQGGRRASLPRGHLVASLTCTPSLLDCFRSKNNYPEGFIPFGIHFLRNTEIGKKTTIWAGPPVNRLVPKIIYKCLIKPINIQNK